MASQRLSRAPRHTPIADDGDQPFEFDAASGEILTGAATEPTSDEPTSDEPTSDEPTSDEPTAAEVAAPPSVPSGGLVEASTVVEPTAVLEPGEYPGSVARTSHSDPVPSGHLIRRRPAHLATIDHDQVLYRPVRALNQALADLLDVEAHPDRQPEEAIALVTEAMTSFQDQTSAWLSPAPTH